jgi:hypothetical protein
LGDARSPEKEGKNQRKANPPFLKKVSIRDAFTFSLKEAICQRDGAYLEYKTAKAKAPEMRAKFQESLAIAIAVKKGTHVDTESNNLKRIES